MRDFISDMWSDGMGKFLLFLLGSTAVVCVLLMSACTVYPFALRTSIETREFTVNHRERANDGPWLVFTDHGVFSVEDSLWLWKFDASDRYNEIKVGETYRCTVAGWRIHFTSDYENLIDCEVKP